MSDDDWRVVCGTPEEARGDYDHDIQRQQEVDEMVDDKAKTIAIVWCIEDVQGERPDLTDEQAWEVLKAVEARHDANIGINWDFIYAVADDLYPEEN